MKKRIFAVLLSLAMLISMTPASVFAAAPETAAPAEPETVEPEAPAAPAEDPTEPSTDPEDPGAVVDSGYCGSNVKWTLYENGLLAITGTGKMMNYARSPWYSRQNQVKTVSIGDGVTSIGDSAFEYCSSLGSIQIPASVTSIGDSAFSYCTSLERVEFGNGSKLESIRHWAFLHCSSLDSIQIPESVTSIGDSAFSYCTSLERVEFGDGSLLESIGRSAFEDCSSLGSIEIPSSVTSIGSNAFEGCSSLDSIQIPSGVTSIASSTFSGCSSLDSIEIPESVTSIGALAFYNCSSLERVEFGDGSLLESIGRSAFEDCSSLGSIEIPASVTSIGRSAFEDCSSLGSIEIPASVTSIGEYAFRGCSSLERVEFRDSSKLESIGDSAFSWCSSLDSIEIPAGVTSIGSNAFWYCSSLERVEFGDSSKLESIGEYAFYSCRSLGSIEIPASVTSIEMWTFYGCSSLESVKFGAGSQLQSIGNHAFCDCSSLGSIEIPAGVTSIGEMAFDSCSSLTAIHVDSDNAYYSSDDFGVLFNKAQTELLMAPGAIREYTIPASVTGIGSYAFFGCSSLERVEFGDGSQLQSIGTYAFQNCSSLGSIEIPTSVTSIGSYAFWYCSSLERVEFGADSQLDYIGEYAFYKCSSLGSIEIPSGVTSIGDFAFSGCSSLWKIRFLGNLPTVVWSAFYDVSAIAFYPEGNATYQNVSSTLGNGTFQWYSDKLLSNDVLAEGECGTGVHWTLNPDGLLMITGTGEMSSHPWSEYKYGVLRCVIMPGVTNIVDSAFKDCGRLQSINIPASVTSIGSYAFSGCSSLTAIYVDSDNAHYSSDEKGILFNKDKTELLVAPCALSGAYTIPASVTSIGEYAFRGCSSLERVEFRDSSKLESIGGSAFSNCSSLGSIEIPASVTSIGSYAFQNCSSLGSIEIPSGVTSIWSSTFSGCSSLKTVRFLGKPQIIGSDAFYKVTATVFYRYGYDWKDLINKNYGGKLTWVPDYGKPVELVYTGEPLYLEVGDSVDPATLSLKQVYDTGYEEPVTEKENVTADDLNTDAPGVKTLTVHYDGLSTKVTVYVHNADRAPISELPESNHPYKSNVNETKTVTSEGAEWLELTFSTNSCLGEGDTLRVTDKTGAVQAQYTGTELAGQTVSVPGDTANLWLFGTGSGGDAYGYKVESAVGVKTHHEYEEETTPATCTQDGKKVYTCSICGDSYEETLPKLNHKWSEEWQHDETHHWHNCENPNCPVENDSEKGDYGAHQWTEWTRDVEPTCAQPGSEHRSCTTCGYREDREVIETVHKWSSTWEHDEDYHWHECENDNCPEKDNTKKGDYGKHQWTEWTRDKEPTCAQPGSEHRSCTTCGYREDREVIETVHNWSSTWEHDEDYHWHNCENPGCPVGNDSDKNSYGEHQWTDWEQETAPSAEADGVEYRECETCGYRQERAVHYVDTESTEWDYVEGGELSLHIDAPMEEFAGVLMDGQPVEEGNYTVTEGSTVVTFHEDYLKTLDDGEHTVTVTFDDGSYAEVTLTIHATVLGDADGDGELTASDLARMRRYIAGLEDGLRLEVLDLDGDGDVTATDLVKLSRRIAGLE